MEAPCRPARASPALTQLTGLRFVAAVAVLLSHLDFLARQPGSQISWVYETLLRQGYCGVSFFYVLSGFILSHAYGKRLASGTVVWRVYLLLRICRIAPLHWAVTLAFLLWLALTDGVPAPGTIILNLTLLHAWIPAVDWHYSLNGPSWSLSDELFFYAAFPLLWRLPSRVLGSCLAGALLLIGLLALVVGSSGAYSPTAEWFFYVAPPVRLSDFLTGVLLYRLYRAGYGAQVAGTTAEVAVTLTIPVAMIAFSLADVPMPLRWQLAYLPLMAAAVFVFAHGRGAITRFLCSPGMVMLGEASFALYLTHRPVITLASRIWTGGPVLLAALAPWVCIGLSLVVFLLFERPLHDRLRQRVRANDRKARGVNAWQPS